MNNGGGRGWGSVGTQLSPNSYFLHYQPLTFNSRVLQQRRHVNVVGMLFHERDVKRRLVEKVLVTRRFSLNLLFLSLNLTDTRIHCRQKYWSRWLYVALSQTTSSLRQENMPSSRTQTCKHVVFKCITRALYLTLGQRRFNFLGVHVHMILYLTERHQKTSQSTCS